MFHVVTAKPLLFWLLQGHITSNNETVSPPKSLSGQHCKKSITSEGDNAMLLANIDRRSPLQQGLMNFQKLTKLTVSRETSHQVLSVHYDKTADIQLGLACKQALRAALRGEGEKLNFQWSLLAGRLTLTKRIRLSCFQW